MLQSILGFFPVYSEKRQLIFEMAMRDFRTRYQGSVFGLMWAFIQPLATMAILLLVFRYGLKAGAKGGVSFAAWFFSGVIAWNFFQDILMINCQVYLEYAYLVKKLNFRLAILPLVKVLSTLMLHVVFIGIVIGIIWITDKPPTLYVLQLFYYTFALAFLGFGLSWLCGSINVFFRDIGQIVGIITQLGFWATPIIWNIEAIPEEYRFLMHLNPVYYIIDGYRKSLVYGEGIWNENPFHALYFWCVAISLFVLAAVVFKKLKPHFADVL